MKKWFFSIRFLAVLVLSFSLLLTACSSNTKTTSSSADKGSKTAKTDSSKPVELSIFVDQSFWPLKDWTGKIPEEITKKTGVKLKVQVATDAQQLPLMISSGNMPDLVFTTSHFQQMSDSNISYTWDDLIKKYNLKDFKIDPYARIINQAADGKLYAVKNGMTPPDLFKKTPAALGNVPSLALRPDILQQLGNPQINSLDDLVNVLKQVKQKYPDMAPLVMEQVSLGNYFRVNLGVPYLGWDKVNGKVTYYAADPKQEDYYLFMNKLYREGLIKAENFTWTDANKAKQMVETGQAFAINNNTATETISSELKAAGKDFKIEQMTKLIGANSKVFANAGGWSGLFVTKSTKHPEAAAKFLQYMHSDEGQKLALWGIEGEDYTMDKPVSEGGYPTFKYNSQDATVQSQMGLVWWGLLADTGLYEQVQRYVPDSNTTKAMVDAKKYITSDPLLGAIDPPAGSPEASIKANIDNLVKNESTKIYLANSESDAKAAYENMIKTMDSLGYSKLQAYAADKYKKAQAEYKKLTK